MDNPEMGTYPVRRKLPVAYSTEIGRIITRFAFLETQLRNITYHLLDISPKQGRVAVRQFRVADQITIIEDLAKLAKIDLKVTWKNLKQPCKEAESYRDRLAHGVWLKHSETETPVLQDFSTAYVRNGAPRKPKIYPLAVPVQLEHLKNITSNIEQLSDLLHVIEERAIRAMRQASRGIRW